MICIGAAPAIDGKDHIEYGKASFYSVKCNGGTHTASGERLVDHANTAAHKSLPFGTIVKVTNLANNKTEVVKITDRGPYVKGRIIDVTRGVASKLGFLKAGVVKVKVEVVKSLDKRHR
jgi:rare lipoprotein A